MAVRDGFRAFIDDILAPLGPLTSKRFFGLDGIKAGNVMLGFVLDETVYFRTGEKDREAYAAEGSKPFVYQTKNGERIVTSYHSLPERLYDEPDELIEWARRAHAAAQEAPSFKARKAKHERRAAKPAKKRIVAKPKKPQRRKAAPRKTSRKQRRRG